MAARVGQVAMNAAFSGKRHRGFACALWVVALGAAAGTTSTVTTPSFRDPLDSPASPLNGARRASDEPLIAVAVSSGRMIAVGLRGLVVYSDTARTAWRQAVVPVQTDLVAVQLLDDRLAWATGHDSVILQSDDGGTSWRKLFDRTASKQVLPAYYQQRVAAGEAGMQRYLTQVKLNTEGDVSLPYLGVSFDDPNNGYAVGAFGMIIATRDGGRSWVPWLDRIDNDEFLNLNSIRGINGEVYIAGERGMVYRLDRRRQRFVGVNTGYNGSFFDIVGTSRSLLAFGLRGAAYRSTDGGATWQAVKTGVERSITAGAVFDEGRRIVLLTETGQSIQSSDDGATFHPTQLPRLPPVYGAGTNGHGSLAVAGFLGVQVHALKSILP